MSIKLVPTLQARLAAKDRCIVELTQQVALLKRECDKLRMELAVYAPVDREEPQPEPLVQLA